MIERGDSRVLRTAALAILAAIVTILGVVMVASTSQVFGHASTESIVFVPILWTAPLAVYLLLGEQKRFKFVVSIAYLAIGIALARGVFASDDSDGSMDFALIPMWLALGLIAEVLVRTSFVALVTSLRSKLTPRHRRPE